MGLEAFEAREWVDVVDIVYGYAYLSGKESFGRVMCVFENGWMDG